MAETQLSDKDKLFCELYINGCAPYTGNAAKCYSEVYKSNKKSDKLDKQRGKEILSRKEIQSYLEQLESMTYEETKAMKHFITENLIHIIEETSYATYKDRRGNAVSPAALRSVAVNASKALMDLYPIKASSTNLANKENGGARGITFNVIVPDRIKEKEKEKEANTEK